MADDQKNVAAAAPEPDDLLTLAEAIDFLGVSKQTLYRMMGRDEIRGVKVGRQWRFRKADLVAYLERGPEAAVYASVPTEALNEMLAELTGDEVADDDGSPDIVISRFVNAILQKALSEHASDIHLEPIRRDGERKLIVRLRIDGVLHETMLLPTFVHPPLIQRIKEMADMNTEERFLPQDGRIHLRADGADYDLRVSAIPTSFGESAVLRILDQTHVFIGLERLEFTPEDMARLERWMTQPSGLITINGPTGSGKTTTLYSIINSINSPTKKLLTIEDPVEYLLPGTIQVGVNRRAGLTFSVALRAFLRQDPDIIMVGEIRDLEMAQLIMQASLTGHMVLSTMHANASFSTLARFVDMGVEPFLVAESLVGALTQRLARKLCQHCRQPVELSPAAYHHIATLAEQGGYAIPKDAVFYQKVGCDQCNQRGYRGRMGIYELLEMTPTVREAFLRDASHEELTAIAVKDGMHTMIADGIRKAAEGMTTVEEVLRVTQ